MKATLASFTSMVTTAFVSGRSRKKVRAFVGIGRALYAGSHGFDIRGSLAGLPVAAAKGQECLAALAAAREEVAAAVAGIPGATVEDNVFAVSAHYRNVADDAAVARVTAAVAAAVGKRSAHLVLRPGKCVVEMRPAVEWHKGKAVRLMIERIVAVAVARQQQHVAGEALAAPTAAGGAAAPGAPATASPPSTPPSAPPGPLLLTVIIIGDDHTDEDMFLEAAALAKDLSTPPSGSGGSGGTGGVVVEVVPIIVAEPVAVEAAATGAGGGTTSVGRMPRATAAAFYLRSPTEVGDFLQRMEAALPPGHTSWADDLGLEEEEEGGVATALA